jgi:polyferredoxin
VQVCPTGIDIRNGLQYECIGCAACVDVCDGVMDKMGYPRGLVRYDTQNGLAQHLDRARCCAMCCGRGCWSTRASCCSSSPAVVVSIATAHAVQGQRRARPRHVMARQVDDGWLENVYRLQIMNATETG